MTDLVVLVLVILWVAFLAPRVVRHFREGGSRSSIEDFHERLHHLERAAPKYVKPAYRLGASGTDEPGSGGLRLAGPAPAHGGLHAGSAARPYPAARRPSVARAHAMQRRRRDVLLALLMLVVVTGALGAMHALHLLWAVTGVSALAIAGYVALVAYAQLLHAERDAARPISSRPSSRSMPPWAEARSVRATDAALPGVETFGPASANAARAGYPGAWDDDELVGAGSQRAAEG